MKEHDRSRVGETEETSGERGASTRTPTRDSRHDRPQYSRGRGEAEMRLCRPGEGQGSSEPRAAGQRREDDGDALRLTTRRDHREDDGDSDDEQSRGRRRRSGIHPCRDGVEGADTGDDGGRDRRGGRPPDVLPGPSQARDGVGDVSDLGGLRRIVDLDDTDHRSVCDLLFPQGLIGIDPSSEGGHERGRASCPRWFVQEVEHFREERADRLVVGQDDVGGAPGAEEGQSRVLHYFSSTTVSVSGSTVTPVAGSV
nr:hypothetical protein [Brachybacterium conglomeratum]